MAFKSSAPRSGLSYRRIVPQRNITVLFAFCGVSWVLFMAVFAYYALL